MKFTPLSVAYRLVCRLADYAFKIFCHKTNPQFSVVLCETKCAG